MGQFISGKNSVLEAIRHQIPLKKIYVLKQWTLLEKPNVPIIVTTKQHLDLLSDYQNHQGFVAQMHEYNYINFEEIIKDKPQKILILDHIQDPQNLGAIIRNANAAGVRHLIIPKDRAVKINPTVLKVASGGQINLKIARVNSLSNVVEKLKKSGTWIYASSLDKRAKDLSTITAFNYPLALIVGNEKTGVSKTLLNLADEIIKINLQGTVQSLNVAVATGIMLFRI